MITLSRTIYSRASAKRTKNWTLSEQSVPGRHTLPFVLVWGLSACFSARYECLERGAITSTDTSELIQSQAEPLMIVVHGS